MIWEIKWQLLICLIYGIVSLETPQGGRFMEFTFHTKYNSDALTAMAKALRKTTRSKRSRRSHIFGWFIVILAVLLSLPRGEEYVIDLNKIVTWIAAAAIIFVFAFEDRLNGLIAKKRMLPGLLSSTVTFSESGYCSKTEVGTSEFSYENIVAISETQRYFILIFSQNHAQVYDKQGLSQGSCDGFPEFITQITGLSIHKV